MPSTGTQRESIRTTAAPAPIGPYSQAVAAGQLVFCSGQIGLDVTTGQLASDVRAQARQAMANLAAVLAAAGCTFGDVVKTTIFLVEMADFEAVNEVYAESFADGAAPARSTVAAAQLPRGARVEIDAIALRR